MKSNYEIRLEKLMEEAIAEEEAINIHPSNQIRHIKGNSRAKRRLGCCKKVVDQRGTAFELEISTMLEKEDDHFIKQVIHHELLHTCRGCLNHGKLWKYLAACINQTYGYEITTTTSLEDKEKIKEARENVYRYEICCTNCGNKGYRVKKSKVILHPENYYCSICGGTLRVRTLNESK